MADDGWVNKTCGGDLTPVPALQVAPSLLFHYSTDFKLCFQQKTIFLVEKHISEEQTVYK